MLGSDASIFGAVCIAIWLNPSVQRTVDVVKFVPDGIPELRLSGAPSFWTVELFADGSVAAGTDAPLISRGPPSIPSM